MPAIDRRSLVLMLIGLSPDGKIGEGLGGITRLQKLLYLLEKEGGLTPTSNGFEFSAYKAGPYSSKLYDDLELLENFGLLDSEIAAEATDAEAAEVDLLSFDELMGESADSEGGKPADGMGAADAYEERRYSLTPDGKQKIEQLLETGDYQPVVDGIRKIKSKYGNHSLSDLLYHVYTKYPEMTVESEIKEKVLKRGKALMGHDEIIDLLLKVHGAIAAGAFGAFYSYSDRSDSFAGSLKGTTDAVAELRRKVISELSEHLTPIFQSPGSVPSLVLGVGGGTYIEHPVNPIGSEAYREALRDFLDDDSQFLCDYLRFHRSIRSWCTWSHVLSVTLLGYVVWQCVTLLLLFVDRESPWTAPDWLLVLLSTVTAFLFIGCIGIFLTRLIYYRTLVSLRVRYSEL